MLDELLELELDEEELDDELLLELDEELLELELEEELLDDDELDDELLLELDELDEELLELELDEEELDDELLLELDEELLELELEEELLDDDELDDELLLELDEEELDEEKLLSRPTRSAPAYVHAASCVIPAPNTPPASSRRNARRSSRWPTSEPEARFDMESCIFTPSNCSLHPKYAVRLFQRQANKPTCGRPARVGRCRSGDRRCRASPRRWPGR
ncbi:MAG: hypothetical protein OXE96_05400 [Gemmatimonadetes bacterium]|nr:hypothetical protein [Gemmatimonadota bacterium]